jgi:hypothetical protein
MNRLFHYTDHEGLQSIQREKFIRQSTNAQTDIKMGPGVYLTKMSPWHFTKEEIAMNNWIRPSDTKKVACLVMVIFPDNEPRLRKGTRDEVGERDVWKYDGNLYLGDY